MTSSSTGRAGCWMVKRYSLSKRLKAPTFLDVSCIMSYTGVRFLHQAFTHSIDGVRTPGFKSVGERYTAAPTPCYHQTNLIMSRSMAGPSLTLDIFSINTLDTGAMAFSFSVFWFFILCMRGLKGLTSLSQVCWSYKSSQ